MCLYKNKCRTRFFLTLEEKRHETTRAALEKCPYINRKLDRTTETHFERDGSIFINRDGTHFRHILNYLRDGEVPNYLTPADVDQLIREAKFYEMTEMVLKLRSSMNSGMGARSRVKKTTKRRRRN